MQKKLIVLACLFFCTTILAQQYPFVYYTPKDGLVNSRVRAIRQDSKGRMYFITFAGLSVYDGTRFVNYDRQNGLAIELVNDVVEAGPDSMLVATNTSQLNTLVNGKIGIYKTADGFCPVINRFLKSKDGHWYVASDNGLYRLDGNKFIKLPFFNKQGVDLGENLDRIIEWNNFFLISPWNTAQKEQLMLFDKKNQVVTDSYTKDQVVRTGITSNGKLWITTPNSIKAIDTTVLQQGKIQVLPRDTSYLTKSEWKNSYALFDNVGNTWIYNNGEVINLSLGHPQPIIPSEEGLRSGSLADIFVDREGITWIAFDGNGVVKMTGTNVQYINSMVPGVPASISAIHQHGDTTWLFNVSDNSVYRISKGKMQSFSLGTLAMKPGDLFTIKQSLYLVDADKVLCIKNYNLAASYNSPLLIFPEVPVNTKIGTGITDINGAYIFHTTTTNGIYLMTVIYDNKVVQEYKLSFAVDQTTIDREGRLWLITRDHHLMVFTLHPEQPSRYMQLAKDYSKEIEGINPRALAIDKSGNVWIGTRYNGLYCFQFHDTVLYSKNQFSTRQGLTDNFVYRLSCDDDNNIWVGTQTGLDKIFLRDDHYVIENVTKSKNIFLLINRIFTGEDKTTWALSNNGAIIKVTPGMPVVKHVAPALLLTSLLINYKERVDTSKVFPYYKNNFSFSVAALSFMDEKSIRYSYLLKGSGNNSWSEPSNNSTFNFINLAPGNYELSVKADFPAALYPPRLMHYPFTIKPPYWQTWWFRTIVSAFIVSLLVMAVRSYYARKLEKEKIILEKQQAIEKERTRIATDMHDDLGAGLSRIKFLSETIGIKKQQHLPIEEEITSIRQYSHEMIDKMGEIVWALNEKNDSLSDLLAYTRVYAVEYLSENGLQITVIAPDDFPSLFLSGEFRRNIYLSVKETLHNIVKHAQADHVTITITIEKNLYITIQDNGIGFDPATIRPYSNGLINIKKRMADIGGEMAIKNLQGTTIILSAALLQ